MKKQIENIVLCVTAIVLTTMAVILLRRTYGIKIIELLWGIIIGAVIIYIYTILHESMHCLAAYIFSIKLIYAQVFHIRYFFSEKKLKISRNHQFYGNSGSCFALPDWYTTKVQWLGFIIAPLLFNLIVVGAAFYFRYGVFTDVRVFCVIYYVSMIICIWSFIPLEGTDAYYIFLFLFRKEEFETIFQTLVLHYAQVFSDDAYQSFHVDSYDYLNRIKSLEVKRDYLEAVLTTQSLRMYQKGLENCVPLTEVLESEARKNYEEGDASYKGIYLFYLYMKGEAVDRVEKLYQLFSDELDSSEECAVCFLHKLLGRSADAAEMETSIAKEKICFEELGICDAYHDISRMYMEI